MPGNEPETPTAVPSGLTNGKTRVVSAEPILDERGDTEIVVEHHSEMCERIDTHQFVYEYFYDPVEGDRESDYVGQFVAWEPPRTQLTHGDFKALEHAERYLGYYGVRVWSMLSSGMIRPDSDEDLVEDDADLKTGSGN